MNKHVTVYEKLRLLGHLSIMSFLQLLAATEPQFFPIIFGGKDVTHDIFGLYTSSDPGRQQWDQIAEIQEPMIPTAGKLDFRRYFWQWACQDPKKHVISIWDPDADKYRYFETNFMQFGSL